MATTKKRTTTAAKPASGSNGRSASNGIAPIRGKARREAIEALIEYTSKDLGLSPEVAATLKDDAWGKRLVDRRLRGAVYRPEPGSVREPRNLSGRFAAGAADAGGHP